jgi:hypothetical protein
MCYKTFLNIYLTKATELFVCCYTVLYYVVLLANEIMRVESD